MGTPTESMDIVYSVTLRISPIGDELELELPARSTGKMIKDHILDAGLDLPLLDPDMNPYIWKLISRGTGKEIGDSRSLYEAGVKSGDALAMVPSLKAGA